MHRRAARILLITLLLAGATARSGEPVPPEKKPAPAQPAPPEKPADPPAPQVPAQAVPVRKRQASLYSLLVVDIGGKLAGTASLMNVTALENGGPDQPMSIKFNQEVGKQMELAAHEGEKHLSVKYNGLPAGWNMELAFEDRYVPKDGPSAAVTCALLMDSVISGTELDKNAAVTGDMNADGSVRPVGGVPEKIRAAARRQCSLVCIPRKNAEALAEYCVVFGPEILAAAHLFDAGTFDEAKAAVALPRIKPIQRALDDFKEIQLHLPRQANPIAWLRHPRVIDKLQSISDDAPGSFSARTLLAFAQGREPKKLSLRGSFEIVYSQVVRARAGGSELPEAYAKRVKESIHRLQSARDRLDPRLRTLTTIVIEYLSSPKSLQASQRINAELQRLRSNPDVVEMLLQE